MSDPTDGLLRLFLAESRKRAALAIHLEARRKRLAYLHTNEVIREAEAQIQDMRRTERAEVAHTIRRRRRPEFMFSKSWRRGRR